MNNLDNAIKCLGINQIFVHHRTNNQEHHFGQLT